MDASETRARTLASPLVSPDSTGRGRLAIAHTTPADHPVPCDRIPMVLLEAIALLLLRGPGTVVYMRFKKSAAEGQNGGWEVR